MVILFVYLVAVALGSEGINKGGAHSSVVVESSEELMHQYTLRTHRHQPSGNNDSYNPEQEVKPASQSRNFLFFTRTQTNLLQLGRGRCYR